MLQWPGVRILRRNELDAFLAQALSPKLYEPDQLQDLKVIYVENVAWGASREYPQTHIKGLLFILRHMQLNDMEEKYSHRANYSHRAKFVISKKKKKKFW